MRYNITGGIYNIPPTVCYITCYAMLYNTVIQIGLTTRVLWVLCQCYAKVLYEHYVSSVMPLAKGYKKVTRKVTKNGN